MRTITAQPGYTATQVEDLIATGQFTYADCFTIVPKSGDEMRYTNYQKDVTVIPIDGLTLQTFTGNKVIIKGLRAKSSLGSEVDQQQLQIDYPDDLLYQAQLSWAKAFLYGRLDGARVKRDRYIAEAPGQPWMGGFPMYRGLVANLSSVGRQSATMNVKSDLILLDVQMPRDLWEANCKNTWGDVNCGVDQEAWAVIGTVSGSPTRTFIPWASSSSEYSLGKILIANGDSTTRVRTISRADGTGLYLTYPLDFDPVPGLQFTAYPGCNRTKDRCPTFHPTDWEQFFKGFPFIPVAETAIGG